MMGLASPPVVWQSSARVAECLSAPVVHSPHDLT